MPWPARAPRRGPTPTPATTSRAYAGPLGHRVLDVHLRHRRRRHQPADPDQVAQGQQPGRGRLPRRTARSSRAPTVWARRGATPTTGPSQEGLYHPLASARALQLDHDGRRPAAEHDPARRRSPGRRACRPTACSPWRSTSPSTTRPSRQVFHLSPSDQEPSPATSTLDTNPGERPTSSTSWPWAATARSRSATTATCRQPPVTGNTRVTMNVVGWYGQADVPDGSSYHPIAGARIIDSRPPGIGPYSTPWTDGMVPVGEHHEQPAAAGPAGDAASPRWPSTSAASTLPPSAGCGRTRPATRYARRRTAARRWRCCRTLSRDNHLIVKVGSRRQDQPRDVQHVGPPRGRRDGLVLRRRRRRWTARCSVR